MEETKSKSAEETKENKIHNSKRTKEGNIPKPTHIPEIASEFSTFGASQFTGLLGLENENGN